MARASIRRRPTTPGDRRLSHEPERREPMPPEAPAAPPPMVDTRDHVRVAAALNVVAGIWLIIAPFVLGYGEGDPRWNDIVFGAIVAVLALARLAAPRLAWISAINMVIGAWIFASAFWLDQTSTASWNDGILGVVVFVLGLIAVIGDRDRRLTTTDGMNA
jgi:peptidoglycan/LPS O-acetylase OafA/YrhL